MDEERELIVLEDEDGNTLTMEEIGNLNYEGREYVMLTEYVEGFDDSDEIEVAIMEVRAVDDENEELVPVDDDLAETLLQIFRSSAFDDDEVFEDEE